MSTVSYRHIRKSFDSNEVIKGANLEIADGEFVVFVGPSGCGKTTLLRLLAGLEELTSGQILIDDKDVTNTPAKDRNIAMVFQNYALYPHMTVAQNIGFGLKLRGSKKAEIAQKTSEAAQLLGLSDLLERKPRQLSGGQRQRVAMGRAIVREPSVFLMDEPLSNLDAQLRSQMRADIKKLQQRLGVTTIYVTHDQVEAMTMADRIVVLQDGEIVQVGTPRELYDNPVNSFVAGFIGQPKMNFIEVSRDGNNCFADAGGIKVPLVGNLKTRADNVDKCLLGIRPKDISPVNGKAYPVTWPAQVSLVEPLGGETLIHAMVGDNNITMQVDKSITCRAGDFIELGIDPETTPLYLFHSETGSVL
jgi:multiple sugar transport system ATP-binding protein